LFQHNKTDRPTDLLLLFLLLLLLLSPPDSVEGWHNAVLPVFAVKKKKKNALFS